MSAALRQAAAAGRAHTARYGRQLGGVLPAQCAQLSATPARALAAARNLGRIVTHARVAAVARHVRRNATPCGRSFSSTPATTSTQPTSLSGGAALESTGTSGRGGSGSGRKSGSSAWTWTGRALAVLTLTTGGKVAHAVAPLHADEPPTHAANTYNVESAQALDRLIRDVWTAVLIAADYANAKRQGLQDWRPVHQRGADRMLRLVQVNRGVYIKLGQHLAQLHMLLPAQYVRTMATTMHDAPQSSPESVRRVLERELGAPPEELFATFDWTPIASASLAQVHRATLHDGTPVAVKVQHDGLAEACKLDVKTVDFLVSWGHKLWPDFDYGWLVEEMKRNLPHELNFEHEGRNAERCGELLKVDPASTQVVVPDIYWKLTTPEVLTMKFEEGCYVNDLAAIKAQGLDPAEVAHLVSDVFGAQIFSHGFVHCDPHAGNILVRKLNGGARAQLVLLDHGLYRQLSPEFRLMYAELWRGLVFGDVDVIKRCCREMGAGDMYKLFAGMLTLRSWHNVSQTSVDSLKTGFRTHAPSPEEAKMLKKYIGQFAREITLILRSVPRELLLLLKTNDCLRAVDHSLGAPINTYVIMARRTSWALYRDSMSRARTLREKWAALVPLVRVETRLRLWTAAVTLRRWFRRFTGLFRRTPATAAP